MSGKGLAVSKLKYVSNQQIYVPTNEALAKKTCKSEIDKLTIDVNNGQTTKIIPRKITI
jgi:hypothetical protein